MFFRQSVHLGYTDFTEEEVKRIVTGLGMEFSGDKYHLMNKNCNHFSTALTQILVGKEIPTWVNRLAYMSSCVPFLQKCLPKEWLTPVALQQTIERPSNSSLETPSTTTSDSSSSGNQHSCGNYSRYRVATSSKHSSKNS